MLRPQRKRSAFAAYGLAVLMVFVAGLVRWLLQPWIGSELPFFTFYFAVLFSSWLGGIWAGMLSLALSYVACDYFFLSPLFSLGLVDRAGLFTSLRFAFVGVFTSLVCEALHRERRRAEDDRAALAKLNDLSSRLWRSTSLPKGLDEMLAAMIDLVGADMGNVHLLHPSRKVLLLAVHQGFKEDFLEHFREVSTAHDSACGRALRSGKRMVIEDVEVDPPFAPLRPIARAAGYRAVQSTPLLGRDGAPLGMVSTHFRKVRHFRKQELHLLDLYARQASDFIERSRTDEALQEADRRKDEFLATLAHELRGPLAPVRNMVEVMKRAPGDQELAGNALAIIERQVQTMVRLIDDLLDVSRITRGKFELRRERIDLQSIVHLAIDASRPAIDAARIELSTVFPSEPIYLQADGVRITQVFANLLSNACKYTRPAGSVSIDATQQNGRAIVSVRDTGIGIPADDLCRVFEMFWQGDRSLERTVGGLGIGLTLVKRLVEMHGGTVTAHSEGVGKGSEFVVSLPTVAPGGSAGTPPALPAKEVGTIGRCILIVDDNRDSANSLALLLQLDGHTTRAVHDSQEALRIAETFKPDVAVLDIGMPNMNGYDLCRALREAPGGTQLLTIALTGMGRREDQMRASEAGFDAHVIKPVDLNVLRKLLAGSRAPSLNEA